jgi:flagellin
MSMRINTNLDALNAQRNLATTGLAYSKSVQKLSSGMRINSAADDAAGLTISEKLRAQTAGLGQASRNAQDGISLIQTGEGALNETASILQRMRELTVQAGNDTLQASDRGAIKSEVDQLSSEIDRIANTTQFNGKTLLNGTLSHTTSASAGTLTGASSLNTFVTAGSSTSTGAGTLSVSALATAGTITASSAGVGAATLGAGAAGNVTINGTQISLVATDTVATAGAKINAANTGLTASGTTTGMTLTSSTVGSSSTVTVSGSAATLTALGLTSTNQTQLTNTGTDAAATFTSSFGMASDNGAAVSAHGNVFTTASGMTVDMSTATLSGTGTVGVAVAAGGAVNLQIGANAGQTLDLSIGKMDASVGGLNVSNLDVSGSTVINNTGPTGTLSRIDAAIAEVSNQRATLGAYQNRLEHTISNLGVSESNLTASESRIRDVDMAAEMVNFTKTGILQQAGQAILAQANQSGSGVMSLLRG